MDFKAKCLGKIQEEVQRYKEKYEILYQNYTDLSEKKLKYEEEIIELKKQNEYLQTKIIQYRN